MAVTIEELIASRPDVSFTAELSAQQVADFRERGFTWIERIAPDEELAWLREVYDRLFAERIEAVPGGYIDLTRPYDSPGADEQPQILLPEARFPEFRKTAFWRNGRELAAKLLGVDAKDLRGWGHMILKPAKTGGPLPWHQDEAYWDTGFDYVALGCWMPLDAATLESGCMRFIPGSHRGGIREHRHLGGDPRIHATEIPDIDASDGVDVPVPAGGAVFHHCRIVHSSRPNRSDRPRRAYANEWQLPPVKRETPADRPWMDETKRAWDARERPRGG